MLASTTLSPRRLPSLLALCVALFVGVVPLRECLAVETLGHSVFALGMHVHSQVADDGRGVAGEVGEVGGGDFSADSDRDESGRCVGVPLEVCARREVVSADRAIAGPSVIAMSSIACLPVASLDAPTADCARAPAPPEVRAPVPAGVRSIVLLR